MDHTQKGMVIDMKTRTVHENEKITRHISLSLDDPDHYQSLELLGKALSSQVRLKILYLLKHQSLNIVELAQKLQIPVSSAAFHVNLLEEAGLITAEMLPGIRQSHGQRTSVWPAQRMASDIRRCGSFYWRQKRYPLSRNTRLCRRMGTD